MPLAEGEHDEPVVAGADRVRVLEREVDEAVARADRVRLLRRRRPHCNETPVPEST